MFYAERRPSDEVLRKFSRIHKAYARKPLTGGTVLDWDGPLLFPECVANLDNKANAFRKPHDSLLSGPSPCNSSNRRDSSWELELIAPIAVGNYTERTSQVWRCDFLGGSKQEFSGKVVVKFYFAGLFPYGNNVNGQTVGYWTDEEGMAVNEARAYQRFRPIQGSQVPYCYGIYEFELPGQMKVKGMVLEDLTRSMRSVTEAYDSSKPKKSGRDLYERWIDQLLTGLCYTLHQIHGCNIRTGFPSLRPTDMLILRSFPTLAPGPEQLVLVGFAFSTPLEEWLSPDGSCLAEREQDGGCVLGHLRTIFRDGITSRWQGYMHSGRHAVFDDPSILFEDPSKKHHFAPRPGEFQHLRCAEDPNTPDVSRERRSDADSYSSYSESDDEGNSRMLGLKV